jgi:hypothetical protein
VKNKSGPENEYYSQNGQIGDNDMKEFAASEFTFGRVPSVAPLKQFC